MCSFKILPVIGAFAVVAIIQFYINIHLFIAPSHDYWTYKSYEVPAPAL